MQGNAPADCTETMKPLICGDNATSTEFPLDIALHTVVNIERFMHYKSVTEA
jgi:hypothetical protein